jgi:hypothetical protein
MAKVPATIAAMNLRAHRKERSIGGGRRRIGQGVKEAGPARAAVEFGVGFEQFMAAAGAFVNAGLIDLIQGARARAFGAVLAQHVELLGAQLGFPLIVGLLDRKLVCGCHGSTTMKRHLTVTRLLPVGRDRDRNRGSRPSYPSG